MTTCPRCGRICGAGQHECLADAPLPETKRCSDCRRDLPAADFHRSLGKYGGRLRRASRCRACQSSYAAAWRERNKESLAAKKRAEREAHPAAYRTWKYNHRARKYGASDLSEAELAPLLDRFGEPCSYGCGRPATTLDHVVPLSRGGAHSVANLALACRQCNAQKRERTPEEWRAAHTTRPPRSARPLRARAGGRSSAPGQRD